MHLILKDISKQKQIPSKSWVQPLTVTVNNSHINTCLNLTNRQTYSRSTSGKYLFILIPFKDNDNSQVIQSQNT